MSENKALEVLTTRRAIRSYQDRVPEKELIEKILEAGTYAPTGMGRQSPIIVAVTNKEIRDRLSRLNAGVMGADSDPFYGAPVVLVVLADKQCPTYLYDGSLVMGNLLNAAHAVGLGSCWIHRAKEVFDSPEGKALLREWGIEGERGHRELHRRVQRAGSTAAQTQKSRLCLSHRLKTGTIMKLRTIAIAAFALSMNTLYA